MGEEKRGSFLHKRRRWPESGFWKEVVKNASERAAEKFDRDLENVLEKYNRDLNNVSRIYKYIAQSISSHEDNKGMTFRVA